MKKLFTLLISLLAVISASASSHEIYVLGQQITGSQTITIGDGFVQYVESSKTLYVYNVTSTIVSSNMVFLRIEEKCTVVFQGTSTITTNSTQAPIYCVGANVTMRGNYTDKFDYDAKLVIKAPKSRGIVASKTLTMEHMTFDITAAEAAVTGLAGGTSSDEAAIFANQYLVLNYVNIQMQSGTGYSPIENFKSVTLSECSFDLWNGVWYHTGKYALYSYDTKEKLSGAKTAVETRGYSVYVNGVQVTDLNRDDILSSDSKNKGKVSMKFYNGTKATYILLDGANIQTTLDDAIKITETKYDVNVLCEPGTTNTVKGAKHAILFEGSSSGETFISTSIINNPATLTVSNTTTGYNAISTNQSMVLVYNINLNATGTFSAIGATGSGTHGLDFNNATASLSGGTYAIAGITSVSYTDSYLYTDCQFSSSLKSYAKLGDASTAVTSANIHRGYGIMVNGVDVTKDNASDVLSSDSKNKGKVTYNNYTKILTLKGVNISTGSSNRGLSIHTDAIVVLGNENTITADENSNYYAVFTHGDVSFTGSGSLTVTSGALPAFRTLPGTLGIKNCTITAQCKGSGENAFHAWSSSECNLVVLNANIKAFSSGGTAIYNYGSISLDGSYYPRYYGYSNKMATYKGSMSQDILIQKGYGFAINGVDIYKENVDTYGTVTTATSTSPMKFTMKAGTYNASSNYGFLTYMPMELSSDGATTITSTGKSTVCAYADLTVSGNFNFTCSTASLPGIIVYDDHNLTMNGATVVCSSYAGIQAASTTSKFTIKDSNVTIKGMSSSYSSVSGFGSLTLSGVEITTPTGATYSTSSNKLLLSTGTVCNQQTVIKSVDYGIAIGGTKITTANRSRVTGTGISGTIYYNPTSKTLVLSNATIAATNARGIDSSVDGLTISLVGTSNITTTNGYAGIFANSGCDMTISGTSSTSTILNIKTDKNTTGAIYWYGSAAAIKNCKINASVGYIYGNSSLTLSDADVYCGGALYGFTSVDMTGLGFAYPINGYYNTSSKYAADHEGNRATDVHINAEEDYKIVVMGQKVTNHNCTDVLNSGTISYDSESSTLTLNNAVFSTAVASGIVFNTTTDVYLKLIGENSINANNSSYYGIDLENRGTVTIYSQSGGSLSLGGGTGIYDNMGAIVIKDCTLTADGALAARNMSGNYSMTVNNANVTFTSPDGAIRNYTKCTVQNGSVTEPAAGISAFNSTLGSFYENGSICTKVVFADLVATDINAPKADTTLCEDGKTYDLRGIEVDGSYKGIVIKNGRKYVQK